MPLGAAERPELSLAECLPSWYFFQPETEFFKPKMNLWHRLFGKTGPGQRSESPSKPLPGTGAIGLKCPFCGALELTPDDGACPYSAWKCSCGSIGASAWLPDLDEVADQLLRMLKINQRVSEAPVATDNSAISLQHYDIDKVGRDLPKILSQHGYEFMAVDWTNEGGNERAFWAKPKSTS